MRRWIAGALLALTTACATPRAQRDAGIGLMVAGLAGAAATSVAITATGEYEPGLVAIPLSGVMSSVGLLLFFTGWSDMRAEREIKGEPERNRSAFDE